VRETVTRFALTCRWRSEESRMLFGAQQGRNTYATEAEAEAARAAFLDEGSGLRERFPLAWSTLEVRPCECWVLASSGEPGDPVGIYFDEERVPW